MIDEDEEDEEEDDKTAVYQAEPFNHDLEALDGDYDPKHAFPVPKEVLLPLLCQKLLESFEWQRLDYTIPWIWICSVISLLLRRRKIAQTSSTITRSGRSTGGDRSLSSYIAAHWSCTSSSALLRP